MAGFTTVFANDLLKLIFHAAAIANIADNAAASPITNLYLSLHTSSPLDAAASGQQTNEVTYAEYARIALVRSASGWTIVDNQVSPVAEVEWPKCLTAITESATHIGIGTASTGAGKLICYGAVTPAIAIAAGVTPRMEQNSTLTLD